MLLLAGTKKFLVPQGYVCRLIEQVQQRTVIFGKQYFSVLLDCIRRLHGFDVKTPGLTSFRGRLYSWKVAQSTPATSKCPKHCRRWHHRGILSVLGISVGAYGRREILPLCVTAGERGENSSRLPRQQCFCAMSLQLAVSVS